MNKIELKKEALKSLSASGTLYQEGRYHEALDMAERAWNCYFELQNLRDRDEDYNDLIYTARTHYERCKEALDQSDDDTPAPNFEEEYATVLKWQKEGEAGDYQSALNAADWFANPDHWSFLHEKGMTVNEYLTRSSQLYQSVVDDEKIWPEYRALAAYHIGRMYMLPLYGSVDMNHALQYLRWAAEQMLDLEHRTERLLLAILQSMVNAATYMGHIPQACHYAAIARENGADMGIFDAVARYGFRHKEKMAGELLEQMIADDTWEGLLIKGQNLLNDWLADMDDPDKDARMAEYADMLSKYYDEHSDAEESYEILGLVLMNYFLRNGMSFFDDNLVDYMQEGLEAGSLWCRYYMGWICDIASEIVSKEGDHERADNFHKTALSQYCLAANRGHRLSIIAYLNMLKDDQADPELIASYEAVARQYDCEI